MSFTVNLGYKKNGRVLFIAHLSRNSSQELIFRFTQDLLLKLVLAQECFRVLTE